MEILDILNHINSKIRIYKERRNEFLNKRWIYLKSESGFVKWEQMGYSGFR